MSRSIIDLTNLRHPLTYFLEVNVKIFSAGIFSCEGGGKAWFELLLVTAAICTTGGLIWWQIPLLIFAFFLGTWCAGFLMLATPDFYTPESHSVVQPVSKALSQISSSNLKKTKQLSGSELEEFVRKMEKMESVLASYPELVNRVPEIEQFAKEVQECTSDARLKSTQERLQREQAYKERRDRERREQAQAVQEYQRYQDWLAQERRKWGYTGGAPMMPGNPPQCRPGYPVKVTRNLTRNSNESYDGIIWMPSDLEYDTLSGVVWCYSSLEEAQMEQGYRFRRPKKRRKNRRS